MNLEIRALDSKVLAVAIEGAVGDWAVYIGAVQGVNFETEAFQVAERGSKTSLEIAKVLFPLWAKKFRWRY